jgi:hypothetical protein
MGLPILLFDMSGELQVKSGEDGDGTSRVPAAKEDGVDDWRLRVASERRNLLEI